MCIRDSCCTSLHVLGVHVDGGMAEYFCHPADMLVKMPEDMTWTDAAMADRIYIEPLTRTTLKRIIEAERPDSILPTLGGQTGLTLAMQLAKEGFLEEYRCV